MGSKIISQRCMETVAHLISNLTADPWRAEVGFSEDIENAHKSIFDAEEAEISEALRTWLQRFQPCLFGRIAARLDLITYCVLTESDLASSDTEIHTKIQKARLEWTKAGYDGRKSAFIIIATSPAIANAEPNEALLKLANRLCYLYLEEEIRQDTIHMDQLFLQIPDSSRHIWRYYCGVNFFSAAGDRRWWNDHRVPGGIAFSVNSVGHLVRTGQIANKLVAIKEQFGVSLDDDWIGSKVDSLEDALAMAMRTISLASDTVSGKATELIAGGDPTESTIACPLALPTSLADKNHCEYRGYYHTDHTIPSVYFSASVERPNSQSQFVLDFTYLWNKDIENPDHFTMGLGKQIRLDAESQRVKVSRASSRQIWADQEVVPIDLYLRRIDCEPGKV